MFFSEDFVSEVVIGDNVVQRSCEESPITFDRKRHIVDTIDEDIRDVHDGFLAPSINYTGYVLLKVQGPNDTVSTHKIFKLKNFYSFKVFKFCKFKCYKHL